MASGRSLLGHPGFSPQSGAVFTLQFRGSSVAESGGQIPSALKEALQTAELTIAAMDTRVGISASFFGTFTCGFYYFISTNYIKRENEHRLDGLPTAHRKNLFLNHSFDCFYKTVYIGRSLPLRESCLFYVSF